MGSKEGWSLNPGEMPGSVYLLNVAPIFKKFGTWKRIGIQEKQMYDQGKQSGEMTKVPSSFKCSVRIKLIHSNFGWSYVFIIF